MIEINVVTCFVTLFKIEKEILKMKVFFFFFTNISRNLRSRIKEL